MKLSTSHHRNLLLSAIICESHTSFSGGQIGNKFTYDFQVYCQEELTIETLAALLIIEDCGGTISVISPFTLIKTLFRLIKKNSDSVNSLKQS